MINLLNNNSESSKFLASANTPAPQLADASQGTRDLAAATGQASQQLNAIAVDQTKTDAKAALNNYELAASTRLGKIQGLKGSQLLQKDKNGLTVADVTQNELASQKSALRAGLSPLAQSAFDDASIDTDRLHIAAANTYLVTQARDYKDTQNKALIDNTARTASLSFQNPNIFSASLDTLAKRVETSMPDGSPPETIEAAKNEVLSKVVVNGINQALDTGNAPLAKTLYDQHLGKIDPDKRSQINKDITNFTEQTNDDEFARSKVKLILEQRSKDFYQGTDKVQVKNSVTQGISNSSKDLAGTSTASSSSPAPNASPDPVPPALTGLQSALNKAKSPLTAADFQKASDASGLSVRMLVAVSYTHLTLPTILRV